MKSFFLIGTALCVAMLSGGRAMDASLSCMVGRIGMPCKANGKDGICKYIPATPTTAPRTTQRVTAPVGRKLFGFLFTTTTKAAQATTKAAATTQKLVGYQCIAKVAPVQTCTLATLNKPCVLPDQSAGVCKNNFPVVFGRNLFGIFQTTTNAARVTAPRTTQRVTAGPATGIVCSKLTCDRGTYHNPGLGCVKCPNGKYNNLVDQKTCKTCAGGKFSTANGIGCSYTKPGICAGKPVNFPCVKNNLPGKCKKNQQQWSYCAIDQATTTKPVVYKWSQWGTCSTASTCDYKNAGVQTRKCTIGGSGLLFGRQLQAQAAKCTGPSSRPCKAKCGDSCKSSVYLSYYCNVQGTCAILPTKPLCKVTTTYEFGSFGTCSKTCGGGVQSRDCFEVLNADGVITKKKTIASACQSAGAATQVCNSQACPTTTTTTTTVDQACVKDQYHSDGFCDDKHNNRICSWDGGDCCGANGKPNQFKYCKQCKCRDPNFKGCTGACGNAKYKGDGYCDDENNNCGCQYDGGDCCGKTSNAKQYDYCKECKCLDPNYDPNACSGVCGAPSYKGDGYCDDNNNNCGCKWDGGDCCGNSKQAQQYKYCTECKCLDPSAKPAPGCTGKGRCLKISFKGDGYCDDENNNCGCSWDGGDCCGNNGNQNQKTYCKSCKCLDPTFVPPATPCTGFCGASSYKGDGFCDDNNNNCGCKWDGGDCCGKSGKKGQYQYCKDCSCKDPARQSLPEPPQKTCTGTCGAGGSYRGDGYCDDANNNCGCEYDGGDCCGVAQKGQFQYCKDCACRDPSKNNPAQGQLCTGVCAAGGSFKGDGYCDDANNNCGCEYDGGDCCGTGKQGQFQYCKGCVCKDPKRQSKPQAGQTCTGTCVAGGAFRGDGYCDDANNNCGCEYDGGDCCGTGKADQFKYCAQCKCLDPQKLG